MLSLPVKLGRATPMLPRRDTDALRTLYEEHVWNVYGFFGYRLSSRADAEELTQRTFERALRAWNRFDPNKGSAGAWLISIARNLLIDHYRRNPSRLEESTADLEELDAAGSRVDEIDIGVSAELADALAALSQRERELIALRYGADRNGPEIAEMTGLSLANVQQILSRSLRKLRDELAVDVGS